MGKYLTIGFCVSWPRAVAAGDTEAAHLEEFTGFSPFISFSSFIGNPAYSNLVSPPLLVCLKARHIYPACSWSSLLCWPTDSQTQLLWSSAILFLPLYMLSFYMPDFGELYHLPSFLRMKPFPLPTSYMHQILYLLNKSHVPPFRFISHMYYSPFHKPCWSFTMLLSYLEVFSDACHHL